MRAKPRLLITGGSGYLGGWGARLARADWDVSATYLSHAADETGIHWRQLDARDEAAVDAFVGEVCPQVVVHTAALNSGQGDDFETVNADGSRNVARAAAPA